MAENGRRAAMGRGGLAVLCVGLLLLVGRAEAAFQMPFHSVRSASLGAAANAAPADATAVFSNVAGLALMDAPEVSFMYSRLYVGLPGVAPLAQGYIAGAVPTRFAAIGVGLGYFGAAGLTQERTVALSLAKSFGPVSLGVTGKHLQHGFSPGSDPMAARDPVFAKGTSRSAFALDFGASARVFETLRVGVSVRNANQPDVGLVTKDPVEREVQAGMQLAARGIGLRVVGDVLMRDGGTAASGGSILPAMGVEKGIAGKAFVVRFGGNPLNFTGGFGIRLGRVGVDYGLVLNP